MARFSQNQALDALARQCIAEGWRVEHTNGDHLRWTAPNGNFIFTASTPGKQRTFQVTISRLRNAWPEWRERTKRDEGKPRREKKRNKVTRGRVFFGPTWNRAQVPDAPKPTLGDLWPADDLLTIPKPPSLW